MYQCDMHVHSSFSPDAEHSPEMVFKIAKNTGLKAVVITDHNLISGIPETLRAAKKYGLDTCCGIEISTTYKRTDFHILGYARQFNEKVLKKGLEETMNGYNDRSRQIVKKCKKFGIADIDFDKLLKKRKGSYVVRRDIAEEIAKQREISYPEAFKFINRGGPAFVLYGEWAMSPRKAMKLIKQVNGIAVLAHPGECLIRTNQPEKLKKILKALIDELIKAGLDGLEAIYSQHTSEMNKEFSELAKDKKLFITGGTDWHGLTYAPEIKLGSSGINYKQFQEFKKLLPH